MEIQTSTVQAQSSQTDAYKQIYEELPPLGSAEYLDLLQNATVRKLPAQVLVRAFRQLLSSGSEVAANATLGKLLSDSEGDDYLKTVRYWVGQRITPGQNRYGIGELIRETILVMVETLPTKRGKYAEKTWTAFSKQCVEDAWRRLNGRRGEKNREKFVEPKKDDETGKIIDPTEEVDSGNALWQNCLEPSKLPWLEDYLRRAASEIDNSEVRYIAEDIVSSDPSPISAGISKGGKPPLTEQMNLNRHQVARRKKHAVTRLKAALLSQDEVRIEREWLTYLSKA